MTCTSNIPVAGAFIRFTELKIFFPYISAMMFCTVWPGGRGGSGTGGGGDGGSTDGGVQSDVSGNKGGDDGGVGASLNSDVGGNRGGDGGNTNGGGVETTDGQGHTDSSGSCRSRGKTKVVSNNGQRSSDGGVVGGPGYRIKRSGNGKGESIGDVQGGSKLIASCNILVPQVIMMLLLMCLVVRVTPNSIGSDNTIKGKSMLFLLEIDFCF